MRSFVATLLRMTMPVILSEATNLDERESYNMRFFADAQNDNAVFSVFF